MHFEICVGRNSQCRLYTHVACMLKGSDSDQKSMIDHFRLIGWKTIDFFFEHGISIIQFWNDRMIYFFPIFFLIFFTSEYAKWQYVTLEKPKEKFYSRFSINFLFLLLTVSFDRFFETN